MMFYDQNPPGSARFRHLVAEVRGCKVSATPQLRHPPLYIRGVVEVAEKAAINEVADWKCKSSVWR